MIEAIAEKEIPVAWATVPVNKNFGDELSHYLNSKILGPDYSIQHANFDADETRLVAIGTILHEFSNGELHVWGTGMDRQLFDPEKFRSTNPTVLAIRGKLSFDTLERNGFINGNCFLGDPGILVSRYITPSPNNTRYELGIIPHLSNYTENSVDEYVFDCFRHVYPNGVKIIHPRLYPGQSIEQKIREITECKRILSSSVHGIIVADSYHIPNIFLHEDHNLPNGLHLRSSSEDLEHRIDDYYSVYQRDEKPFYNHRRSDKFDIDGIIQAVDQEYQEKEIIQMCEGLIESHPANAYLR
jgi:pyruvyltransferase